MKIKTCMKIGFLALIVGGCATPGVPYTFVSTYQPETLPKVDSSPGSNSISGSAFLRQGGGGIVNCAGNSVVLRKQVSLGLARNAYAKEYLALPYRDRAVTVTDPALIQFESDLAGIRGSMNKTAYCDVDGKFKFNSLKPGSYSVKTKVYWVVGDQGQGGILGSSVVIPDNSVNQDISTVVTTITKSCSIYSFGGCTP